MILEQAKKYLGGFSVPRVGGGDPNIMEQAHIDKVCSPRRRG